MRVEKLGCGYTWLDAGTQDSLLEAAQLVRAIEQRQGLKIACLEEIAYRKGFIGEEQFARLAESFGKNDYGGYLWKIFEERREATRSDT